MTETGCARSWEAEALQDGRLTGDERLSFERHALHCDVCKAETQAWERLRLAFQPAPSRRGTPFDRQRRRNRLLRAANERLVRAPSLGRALIRWVPVVVTLLVVVAGASVWRARHVLPRSPVFPFERPAFEVRAINGASWTNRSEGAVARVVLEQGTVSVHVHHLLSGQRFLLLLPDGQLEVHGTRFIVEVADHRTARIEVTEGVVSFRLEGRDERYLRAGERWTPTPPAAAPESAAAPEAGVAWPSSGAAIESVAHPAELHRVPPARVRARPPRAEPRETAWRAPSAKSGSDPPLPPPATSGGAGVNDTAAARFATALDAFDALAFTRADALFARFASDFPDDPRTEDALFLRAVARARAGDRAGAATLARDYLARFPRGLRRPECEALLRDAR